MPSERHLGRLSWEGEAQGLQGMPPRQGPGALPPGGRAGCRPSPAPDRRGRSAGACGCGGGALRDVPARSRASRPGPPGASPFGSSHRVQGAAAEASAAFAPPALGGASLGRPHHRRPGGALHGGPSRIAALRHGMGAAAAATLSAPSRRRLGGRRLRLSRQVLQARPPGRRHSRQAPPAPPRRLRVRRRRGRPSRLALLRGARPAAPRPLPPAVPRQCLPSLAPTAAAQDAGRRTTLHAAPSDACSRAAIGRTRQCVRPGSLLRCGPPPCLPIGGRRRTVRRPAIARQLRATRAYRGSRPPTVRPRPPLQPRQRLSRRRLLRAPHRQGGAWRRRPGGDRRASHRRSTSATLAIRPGRRPMSRRHIQAPPPRPPIQWRLQQRPGTRTATVTRRPAGPPQRSRSPSLPSRTRRNPKSPTTLAAGVGPNAPRRAPHQLRPLRMSAWSLMTPGPPIVGPRIGVGRATMRAAQNAAGRR